MKQDLRSAMEKRTVVKPANLYEPVEDTAGKKVVKAVKPTKPQVDKTTSGQVVKYTTHLPDSMVTNIKVFAVKNGLKDYEVVLKALAGFFGNSGSDK